MCFWLLATVLSSIQGSRFELSTEIIRTKYLANPRRQRKTCVMAKVYVRSSAILLPPLLGICKIRIHTTKTWFDGAFLRFSYLLGICSETFAIAATWVCDQEMQETQDKKHILDKSFKRVVVFPLAPPLDNAIFFAPFLF